MIIMKIYGISNCDRCRKARQWLDRSDRPHEWIDLRADGIDQATIAGWIDAVGVDVLVNRRSTTWRQLDEAERKRADSPTGAAGLLHDQPTLIKRPVIDLNGTILVGFDDGVKRAL